MPQPTVDRSARLCGRIAVALGVAAVVVGALAWQRGRSLPEPSFLRHAAERYGELWQELDRLAADGARNIAALPDRGADPAAFGELAGALPAAAGGRSLFLIDRFGGLIAWAGDGLAHPLPQLASAGRRFRAGFSAVSLTAGRPLAGDPSGRAVVAGASFATDRLPFRLPRGAERDVLWTLVEPEAPRDAAALVVETPGAPVLLLRRLPSATARSEPSLTAVALALAAASAAFAWGRVSSRVRLRTTAAAVAVGAAALAAGARPAPTVALVTGIFAVTAAWRTQERRGGPWRAPALGAAAGAAVVGLAFGVLRASFPLDLSATFLGGDPSGTTWRFTLFLGALAIWALLGALVGRASRPVRPPRAQFTLAVAMLVAAALTAPRPPLALMLLILGSALVGRWAGGLTARPPTVRLALLSLLAAASAAVAAEAAYGVALRRRLESLLPAMAPPTRQELAGAAAELRRFFAGLDLADLTPGDPRPLERSDLAYWLWRRAPLRHERALSALRAEPLAAEASEFALGLTLADGGLLEGPPSGASSPRTPVWDFTLIADEALLRWRGEPWARIRYWLLPQPGFALPGDDPEGLSRRLLLGGPGLPRTVERQLAPARYGLYDRDGVALISPWPVDATLPPLLRSAGRGPVATPEGPAWGVAAAEPDGTRLLVLPRPSALKALERAGTAVTGMLVLGALVIVTALALRSGDPAFRASLSRPLKSYSIRLVVVFSLLLLLPAVAVNFLILAAMSRRLANEQRAAGETALESAERVLSDYAAAQAPGVGIDTVLDDELLAWLSEVLGTEVNLYFGGTVYATSKRELFTAGLLRERVPGEIYSHLSLLGDRHASRSSRAGNVDYRELYAPILVPGAGPGTSLFVSLPRVAQQEDVAEELAAIRRQVVVATAGLILLLAALGARLARGFTAPLTAILDGTRRIAAGAPSLGLTPPAVFELSTLVEAIDRMAARLAEGRQRLLREKRVVEQMVEHSTAAVVSLDGEQRVLLQNGLAAELLGTAVGESLPERLASADRLAPVAAFVGGERGRLRRVTVRLPVTDEQEPREWSLVWVPIAGEGEPAALFVVEDISDVLRGQRLSAWAEMARIIAHEIKNPLTPIRLSAEHMREVRDRDPQHFDEVFERCTTNILEHVDELQAIASEFSTYSRIPRSELKEGDLARFAAQVVDGYRAAPPPGVAIEYEAESEEIRTRFDARLLGRALRNLVENALRATARGGRVTVRTRWRGREVEIEVEDDGPGVPATDLDRIFEPYFSTHDSGTGLGLPIARRIAEEHGGRIGARNRDGGGLRVTMSWPAA